MNSDVFDAYLTKANDLVAFLQSQSREEHAEALVLQARLVENIATMRKYGDTEQSRADRAKIVENIGRIMSKYDLTDFSTTVVTHHQSATKHRSVDRHLYLPFIFGRNLGVYNDQLVNELSYSGVPRSTAGRGWSEIYVTPMLAEHSQIYRAGIQSIRAADIDTALHARRIVILGEPGSGKTTLLKHLANRLVTHDMTLDQVMRGLVPSRLYKLVEKLHTDLLYLGHPDVSTRGFDLAWWLAKWSFLIFGLFAMIGYWVILDPRIWVEILMQEPLNERLAEGIRLSAIYAGVWFTLGVGLAVLISLLLIWANDRRRVNRFMSLLKSRLRSGWPIPVYVRLSEYASQHVDLHDYLVEHLRSRGLKCSRADVERLSVTGKLLFLFDGLDEVGSKRSYWDTERNIIKFARGFPRAIIIVTCRTSAFDHHSMTDFSRFSIRGFDDEQIRVVVERTFHNSPQSSSDFLQQLNLNSRLRLVAANPFLLSIMLAVYNLRGHLPHRRRLLYEACVESLLVSRRTVPETRDTVDQSQIMDVLIMTGYEAHRTARISLPETEIRTLVAGIASNLATDHDLLKEIEDRTGLLHRVSKTDYAFRHLGFQEYFASLAVAHDIERTEHLVKNLTEPWWREVVVLSMSREDNSPRLNGAVVKASKESVNGFLLALACLNEGIDLSGVQRDQLITDAVSWLRTSPDYLRVVELGRLEKTLEGELWTKIHDWLSEDDPDTSLRALNIATLIDAKLSLPAITQYAITTSSPMIRRAAIHALGRIDETSAIELLLAGVWSGDSIELRQRAAAAISCLGNRACERLISYLTTPSINTRIRVAVAEVLDSVMVEVEKGGFWMGDNRGGPDEAPAHTVLLDTFWIDRYQVTNAQYARFVKATGYRAPGHWKNDSFQPGTEGLPVTRVSWFDASAYAKWTGKRLPTEPEWEKCARGCDGQQFPWGDRFEAHRCNWFEAPAGGDLSPVGSFTAGVSPYGAYDMAGNVWEWVDDWYQPYDGSLYRDSAFGQKHKVIRGGSKSSTDESELRCAQRLYDEPETRWSNVGFRCVSDSPPL